MTHDATSPEPAATSDDNVTPIKPTVDPELEGKVRALAALAATHHHLGRAHHPLAVAAQVQECLEFLTILHSQLLEEALVHPDADKVEQLIEVKKQRAAEESTSEQA